MVRTLFAVTLALVAGCSGDGNQMPAPPDMSRGPMDHPDLWHIKSNGGDVQAAPEVYTVVWAGSEQIGQQVVEFLDWMLNSDYWKNSLKEYGVGQGVSKGLIVLPGPAPDKITDAQLQTLVGTLVSSGQVTRTDNTQVAFLPPATTLVAALGANGCDVFAGYHDHTKPITSGVAYSVDLQCEGEAGVAIDQLTRVLSHETAEAATDPVPPNGFVADGPVPQEISDLCNFGAGLPVDVPADATHPARRYWVQRQYSGQVALLNNQDPCIPLPWNRPYWNVAIDPGTILSAATATKLTVNARLAVFSYGDVGLIKWLASSADGSGTVDPDSGEAHAGDTIPITITLGSGQRGTYEFDVEAESEKAGSAAWFSYVVVQ
jgi:hypothetical protein